jgi:hypothetical protein
MIGFLVLIVLFSAILQFPSEVIENVGGKMPSLLGRFGHSAKFSSGKISKFNFKICLIKKICEKILFCQVKKKKCAPVVSSRK